MKASPDANKLAKSWSDFGESRLKAGGGGETESAGGVQVK